MNKSIVIYKSKYGSSKKYAQWLKEELSCDALDVSASGSIELEKYNLVILVGGIYASGIAITKFLKTNLTRLSESKVVILAVGASPFDENALAQIKAHNLKDISKEIPVFYCRGAFDQSIMTFRDRTLCRMLKKALSKKDPATFEPWMSALFAADEKACDWTERDNLRVILEYIGSI